MKVTLIYISFSMFSLKSGHDLNWVSLPVKNILHTILPRMKAPPCIQAHGLGSGLFT